MTEITRDTGYETAWKEGEGEKSAPASEAVKAAQDAATTEREVYINAHNETDDDGKVVVKAVQPSDVKATDTVGDTDLKVEAKPESFKAAFARHRAAGDKVFDWNGKKYTTELASEKKAPAAKPAVKPAAESVVKKPAAVAKADDKIDVTVNAENPSVDKPEMFNKIDVSKNPTAETKPAAKPAGRGVINTDNVSDKTLLPKK